MPSRFFRRCEVTAPADFCSGSAAAPTSARASAAATCGGVFDSPSLGSAPGIGCSVVKVHSPFPSALAVPMGLPSAVMVTDVFGSARPANTDVPCGSMRAMSKDG
jgi:hypothetical protein